MAVVGDAGDGGVTAEDGRQHAAIAGRVLSFLFIASGFATFGTILLPKPEGFHVAGVAAIGVTAVVSGIAGRFVPWGRLPLRASLLAIPAAFTLISIHNVAGGADAYRYSLFYLVAFVWIGMFQARWTAASMAALLVPSYLAPLLITGAPASAVASVFYAVPLLVLVGEIIAWQACRLDVLRRQLTHQALRDPLTGLPNRRLLLESIAPALARAERMGEPVGLLFLDLDGFKSVNDRFGHSAGDELLVAVADALRSTTRATDLPARLAGDEFAVLVERPRGDEPLTVLADRIGAEIARSTTAQGLRVDVSIGMATWDGSADPDELLRRADADMYRHKRRGVALTPPVHLTPSAEVIEAGAG